MKSHHNKQLLILTIGVFLISTSGPLGRYINMPPPVTIWWRCLLAFIVMLAYCYAKGISLKAKKKDLPSLILNGLLMGGHWITYFYALRYSSVALGMLSLYTFPVMIALLEPFFNKTKLNPIHILLCFIVLLGMYVLAPEFSLKNDNFIGVLFGILSALFFALRTLIMKKHIVKYDGSMLMTYQLLVVVIAFAPILFFLDAKNLSSVYPYIIVLAVATTAIGHTLFVKSLKHFSATTASIISSLQPVFGIILAYFTLNEIPTINTFIGGFLIISTVVIESINSRQ